MCGIQKCTANTVNTSKYETLEVTQYNRRLKLMNKFLSVPDVCVCVFSVFAACVFKVVSLLNRIFTLFTTSKVLISILLLPFSFPQ